MVDEQNTHTEETELPSPLEFRKDSEEENRDSEKDEDTKELEAVTCEFNTMQWKSVTCLQTFYLRFTLLPWLNFIVGYFQST